MDILSLRESLGDGTEDQLVAGVHAADPDVETLEEARSWLWVMIQKLLNSGRYGAAATLLWGPHLFDSRPAAVRKVIKGYQTEAKCIFLGAGSMSKSYTLVTMLMLDWLRDPHYTETKIISSTRGHAKGQVFSTLQRYYQESIVPLPGVAQDGFVGLNPKDRHTGISLIAIPAGETGKGALQGFHPLPRASQHPQFGWKSRLRVFLDEAEEIPIGVWRGIGNLLGSMGGDSVKVMAATNPADATSILAQHAEPVKGWNMVDASSDKEWDSQLGWHVIRLDGADSENVIFRREVYPGLLTYEGYENLRMKNNGNSPDFSTFARAMYPLAGADRSMIPHSLLDDVKGTLIFQGRVVPVGAVDLAFEGDDDVFYCASRYGRAVGFRPADGGEAIMFAEPIYCLQVDQFYELPKLRSHQQYLQVREYSEQLGIPPDWLTLDTTGNGKGVCDLCYELWSTAIQPINWGNAATDTKILEESQDFASEVFEGIHTEMYGALRDWLEYGYIKFSPHLETQKLYQEITGRRYKATGKGKTGKLTIRIEKKEEFKKRNGRSPDRADSLVMCLHRARTNGPEKAAATVARRRPRQFRDGTSNLSKVKFVDFTSE